MAALPPGAPPPTPEPETPPEGTEEAPKGFFLDPRRYSTEAGRRFIFPVHLFGVLMLLLSILQSAPLPAALGWLVLGWDSIGMNHYRKKMRLDPSPFFNSVFVWVAFAMAIWEGYQGYKLWPALVYP